MASCVAIGGGWLGPKSGFDFEFLPPTSGCLDGSARCGPCLETTQEDRAQAPFRVADKPARGRIASRQKFNTMPLSAARNAALIHPGREAPSDEELVAGALNGNDEAFRQLYERFRRPVAATVMRILKDRKDAEDAVQEIFVKVYNALSHWDAGRARFSTWLYRLAANHAVDCWRIRRRRCALQSVDAGQSVEAPGRRLAESVPEPLGPERLLACRERAAVVRRCVRELPEVHRKMIILRHFHGMKLKEIAEMEGCNLATVKSSLYRAMQHLRRHLLLAKELWENGLDRGPAVSLAARG